MQFIYRPVEWRFLGYVWLWMKNERKQTENLSFCLRIRILSETAYIYHALHAKYNCNLELH
jgi:hypothetical protein